MRDSKPYTPPVNFREIGAAGAIRPGLLFRSAMTVTGDDAAHRWIERVGIRTVFDLRSQRERQEFPHCCEDDRGITYIAHDHDSLTGNIMKLVSDPSVGADTLQAAMIELYRRLPFEFATPYAQLFQEIADGPLPVLVTCTAGKDRTGVASALLLSILGLPPDMILRDYRETQRHVGNIAAMLRQRGYGEILEIEAEQRWRPALGCDPSYLDAMFEAITAASGSMDDYVDTWLRLDAPLIDRLRRRLLC